MSTDQSFVGFACPGDAENHHSGNHRFMHSHPLTLLKKNSDSGCQLCRLLYLGIEGYHGDLVKQHLDDLTFTRFASYNASLRVNISLPGFEIKNSQMEFVYEEESWDSKPPLTGKPEPKHVDGVYSQFEILPGRQLPEFAEKSVDLIKSWIQSCVENHPRCQTSLDASLPKRVLDIGTLNEPSVSLYESEGEDASYAALSHRWGQTRLITTTKGTLKARKNGIEWADLSRTFQDAINVSRLLELRYIWIDSLCIVQDDAVDWQVESSKMARIYENSYITISANNTRGALIGEQGLRNSYSSQLKLERLGEEPIKIIVRSLNDHGSFFAGSLEGVGVDSEDYPLSKRAWCFQERLLATRILHFIDEEVVFECKTHCDCECGGTKHHSLSTPLKHLYGEIIRKDFRQTGLATNAWEGWTMFASPYILKNITKSTDILPALAGVASRMQCDDLGQYIAGLWQRYLPRGLFWYADVIYSQETNVSTAPSFSWAALAATSKVRQLQWPFWSDDIQLQQHFDILEIQCPVAGLNPYGIVSISTAFIKLKAILLPITLNIDKTRPYNSIVRSKSGKKLVKAFLDVIPITSLTVETSFVCLLGFSWVHDFERPVLHGVSSLLLKPLGNDRYQRVGCLPYLENDPAWFADAEEKTIVII